MKIIALEQMETLYMSSLAIQRISSLVLQSVRRS
jgi:hypothetical protein